jgi:hypothetical protein
LEAETGSVAVLGVGLLLEHPRDDRVRLLADAGGPFE